MNQFPLVDPIPLPGPVWLFKSLHLLTMALHFSAMYFLVGGLAITVWWQLRGRFRNDPLRLDASGVVAQRLPIVTAFVINLGMPPLVGTQDEIEAMTVYMDQLLNKPAPLVTAGSH